MKKNLRIVSAAAAALLAVAPVAAAGVSTVFADTNVTVEGGTAQSSTNKATLKLSLTNLASLAVNDPASKATASLSTPVLPAGANVAVSKAQIYTAVADATGNDKGKVGSGDAVKQLDNLSTTYYVAVKVTITGLSASTDYAITANGTTTTVRSDATGTIANFGIVSDGFTLNDTSKLGSPYLKENRAGGKAVQNGSVNLGNGQYSVAAVVAAIRGKYAADVTDGSANKATASFAHLTQDVRDAVKAAGITTKADANESFDKPAAPFSITVNLSATNGRTSTALITVDPNSTVADSTYPRISYYVKGHTKVTVPSANGQDASTTIDSVDDLVDALNNEFSFNYVPVNGVVDTASIKRAFTAQVSEANTTVLDTTVDVSKVNTKVAGRYPVTVSATNADGKTTKVTFMLTVGAKGATYKTVQSDGDVPVYKIDGNNVTDSKTTVKNGDTIAVFGDPIKVGEKSYTRINSADSDLYVESKYVDGSFKPADKVKKTVMHNSYIYDKDHKRVGTDMLRAYSTVEVIGAATKLADGSLVYQIADNQYVMADNIDGTSRTLSHNAYVYKTSKKRANRKVLKAGSKVTTFGSPYTFKNGKAYYRVGGPAKQYVKVANFAK
ncbi:Surface layer protein HAP50 [Lactobacillus kullabergensis]|uniref:Surface layer protein HAP50 n=1 Tax=Lactobacillus kullabergensis TaxID=1218493 RepID=A0A0F4L758_9LACO|nr:SLAP domain-containing protein [Lactobacillus kullabergensis]KJY54460.1 Surface layer protein HAP50 [Lactobacillus kullabergensis]